MAKGDVTKTQIRQALAKLGSTSDQIAKSLKKRKITGVRGAVEKCPIANYLRQTCKPKGDFCSIDNIIAVDGVSIEIPTYIDRFINAFDSGSYPELVNASKV